MLQDSCALNDFSSSISISSDKFCETLKLICFSVCQMWNLPVHLQCYSEQIVVGCDDDIFHFPCLWRRAYFQSPLSQLGALCLLYRLELSVSSLLFSISAGMIVGSKAFRETVW